MSFTDYPETQISAWRRHFLFLQRFLFSVDFLCIFSFLVFISWQTSCVASMTFSFLEEFLNSISHSPLKFFISETVWHLRVLSLLNFFSEFPVLWFCVTNSQAEFLFKIEILCDCLSVSSCFAGYKFACLRLYAFAFFNFPAVPPATSQRLCFRWCVSRRT